MTASNDPGQLMSVMILGLMGESLAQLTQSATVVGCARPSWSIASAAPCRRWKAAGGRDRTKPQRRAPAAGACGRRQRHQCARDHRADRRLISIDAFQVQFNHEGAAMRFVGELLLSFDRAQVLADGHAADAPSLG